MSNEKKPVKEAQRTETPIRVEAESLGQLVVKPAPEKPAAPSLPQPAAVVAPWAVNALSPAQQAVLSADPTDDEIEIKPTGELYLPHYAIRARLNKALGPGQWRMVELGDPIKGNREVIWRQRLEFANGWSASTVGHGFYFENNPNASYGDALETCKSDALTRAVKDLGIGTQLLERRYREAWKQEHCIQVYRTGSMKLSWRRKDAIPFVDEQLNRDAPGPDYTRLRDFYDEARDHMAEMTSKRPDLHRLERAEQEGWTQEQELTEEQRLAIEDELFRDIKD